MLVPYKASCESVEQSDSAQQPCEELKIDAGQRLYVVGGSDAGLDEIAFWARHVGE